MPRCLLSRNFDLYLCSFSLSPPLSLPFFLPFLRHVLPIHPLLSEDRRKGGSRRFLAEQSLEQEARETRDHMAALLKIIRVHYSRIILQRRSQIIISAKTTREKRLRLSAGLSALSPRSLHLLMHKLFPPNFKAASKLNYTATSRIGNSVFD